MCMCNIIKQYEFLRNVTGTKPGKLPELIRKASSTSLSAIAELILNAFSVPIYGEERVVLQRHRGVINKIKNRKSLKLEFFRTFIIENRKDIVDVVTIVLNHLLESQMLDLSLTCEDVESIDDSIESD